MTKIINKIKNLFRTTYYITSVTDYYAVSDINNITSIDNNIMICELAIGETLGYNVYRKHHFNAYIYIAFVYGKKEEIIKRIKSGLYSRESMIKYNSLWEQINKNVKKWRC